MRSENDMIKAEVWLSGKNGGIDMNMEWKDYFEKLQGCYTGKAVGGTLGMPLEGYIGTKNVTYYDPVPMHMIENDDIDLQVVWLEVIRECGLPVNRFDLANGWLKHMRGLPDEYGVVMRNLKHGLYPSLSGGYDNKFTAGMGAAIRTEIWAALAPGDPDLAVKLAVEDACCDHAKDGVDAAVFLAAFESLAYVESDVSVLFERSLSYLPKEGRVYQMITQTLAMWKDGLASREIRSRLLDRYFSQNWTDVGINLSFITIGLLDGETENEPKKKVSRGLYTAVGLGHDADCTGATLGAIFGILYPDGFEEHWTKPLGDQLVLSGCIAAMHETETIHDFCLQIADACRQVQAYYGSVIQLSDCEQISHRKIRIITEKEAAVSLFSGEAERENANESLISIEPYIIRLTYPEDIAFTPGGSGSMTAFVTRTKNMPMNGTVHLSVSDGWKVKPDSFMLSSEETVFTFTITAPDRLKRRMWGSFLHFDLEENGFSCRTDAGLILSYPVKRREMIWTGDTCPKPEVFSDAVTEQWKAHYAPVPAGGQLYSFEVRSPYIVSEAIMVAQASRPVKVWKDGELILSHDGTECNPAFHRTENIARLSFDGNWSRFVIYVSDQVHTGENQTPFSAYAKVPGCPTPYEQRRLYDRKFGIYEDGELFIGFAERRCYEWLYELEWR